MVYPGPPVGGSGVDAPPTTPYPTETTRKATPLATAPGQRLRTEGEVAPDTWGEYAAWKLTKRMKPRDRQVILAFSAIDIDLRDALDEAIHEALASTAALADLIMSNDPTDLMVASSKEHVASRIGEVLFSTTMICDILAENWGVGQLIIGNHFAQTEDLTSVSGFVEKVMQTLSAPTEIVGAWKTKALLTTTGILIGIGALSSAFSKLRWDDGEFDIDKQATKFMECMACVEIVAAFFGLTLTQCLTVNQARQNTLYPQGWKPAGEQRPE